MAQDNHDNERIWVKSVNGKRVGWRKGDVFYRKVSGLRHQLREPPAWALDAEAYDKQIKDNVSKIVITDTDANITYYVSVNEFDKFKEEIEYAGHGRQYFLRLYRWEVEGEERVVQERFM